MAATTAKISSKGQITLPAAMRRKLGTSRVRVSMSGDRVVIEPDTDLGGSLSRYAKTSGLSVAAETERAWDGVARDHAKNSPRR
ncbi:MAG: AbrB/MazE/SpoVT family DNA-binding domain-containing protein [Nevskia sp.]|nr:AbrB/MazE/SpoVT family DNA-binding domain-containing protein [Nevskia sp.]